MTKITNATFILTGDRGVFVVKFYYPDGGHDPGCSIEHRGKTTRIPNPKRRYKPCQTHCLDLIALAISEPPPNQFAANRKKAAHRDVKALAGLGRQTRKAKSHKLKMVGGPEQ